MSPRVTTSNASAITATTALLAGAVTDSGNATITERGICLDTSVHPTIAHMKFPGGSGFGSFTAIATGLVPHKTYFMRAYAINSTGLAYGNELSFTTADTSINPPPPAMLVKKIVIYQGGPFPADSSIFFYDSDNRLVLEQYQGQVLGAGTSRVLTSITRNSAGIITGYIRTYTVVATGAVRQAVAVVNHDPSTGHYLNKVVTYSSGFPKVSDSTYYVYTGNNPTYQYRYDKTTAASAYYGAHNTTYAYANNSSELIRAYTNWFYIPGNEWLGGIDLTIHYDLKNNPLNMPDVGLVVEFMLQEAEDDNLNWNWSTMCPYIVSQTVTGGQYANLNYTYLNDYPLTRTYNDIGVFINSVAYTY